MATNTTLETFPRWVLGITASAVVAIGGGLLTTMIMLREDMAVVKSHITELRNTTVKVDVLERTVIGHEYRITSLERDGVVVSRDTVKVLRAR